MEKESNVVVLGEEAVAALWEVEYFLISLRNIGLYYYMQDEVTSEDEREYRLETARFVNDSCMVSRLGKVREILSAKFEACYGPNEMMSFRRKLRRKRFWKPD